MPEQMKQDSCPDLLLREKLEVRGVEVLPLAYITRVDEPEFGCEGRPDGMPVMADLYGFDRSGSPAGWRIEERELWRSGLDDGALVCVLPLRDGMETPCLYFPDSGELKRTAPGAWLRLFSVDCASQP